MKKKSPKYGLCMLLLLESGGAMFRMTFSEEANASADSQTLPVVVAVIVDEYADEEFSLLCLSWEAIPVFDEGFDNGVKCEGDRVTE